MPEDAALPARYPDDAALMQDALDLLTLRLDREMLCRRAEAGGTALPDTMELDARVEALAQAMGGRLAVSGDLALPRLISTFALSDLEVEILLTVVAPAFDPRIGNVYAWLQDDAARMTPSLGLIHVLMQGRADLADLRAALDPALPLRRYRLVLRADGDRETGLADAPLVAEDAVCDLLLGREALDGALAGLVQVLDPGSIPPRPEARDVSLPIALGCDGDPGEAALALAAGLGGPVHWLDWACWQHLPTAEQRGRLARATRAARIGAALPVLSGFEAAPHPVLRALAEDAEAPLVLATGGPVFWRDAGVMCRLLNVAGTCAASRDGVWRALGGQDRAPEAPLAEMPGLAADVASDRMGGLDLALRARARRQMSGLAQEVRPIFTLEDLVFPQATASRLASLVDRQRVAAHTRDDWGLDAAFDAGGGTCALFAGPSGTGKTAAASAIGAALGLPVWRVDLAGTVSKYIGETEKNLHRVFSAAAWAGVILIFDEADALFGKRSEVSDSHDRYANIQVSYLLQRIEAHQGITILATNLQQNMDEAFLRRIDHLIAFPVPGAGERRRIWARLEASGAPLAPDLDLDLVARRFELTGGVIRTCAIAAAEAAAIGGRAIGMAEVMQAVAQELSKAGRPIRKADFQGYGACLKGVG